MKITNENFEARKREVLREAKEQGIVDVVSASTDGVSLEMVEVATRLMKKHGPVLYKELEEQRKAQR